MNPTPRARRRRALTWLAALPALAVSSLHAQAPAWPTRPITLIVPYVAGGGADSRSRQIGQYLNRALGQPVIIENKAGAGGNIGTELVAKARPDGYTIGMGNFAPLSVNQALYGRLGFDPQRDLIPIVLIERGPLVLTVTSRSPLHSVADVIAAARAAPGKLTYASGGMGGSHHLSGELFKQATGIDLLHVPYKGGAAAITDLFGGNVDMMFEQMYSAMPNIRAGKLRPLAITSGTRSPLLPEVPTMAEAGAPGVEVLNWQGLIAPRGTPAAVVARINGLVNQALRDPVIRQQILDQGNEVGGGSPEEFGRLITAETQKWSRLVRARGLKPE